MVLDYMKQAGQISPELQMQAEDFVAQGYQLLLTFEVPGGGFSLFGDAPADRMLSAYGLMELSDMRRVYPVDEALIERTATWLLSQRNADGSWDAGEGWREAAALNAMQGRLPTTAFIVWALAEAGYGDQVLGSVSYLLDHLSEAEDPYVLALCANALASVDAQISGAVWALDQLARQAQFEGEVRPQEGGAVYWQTELRTFMGGGGRVGSMEVTALAAQALLRAGQHPELAQGALTYLIQQKDSFGTWDTTQATIWALQALLLSALQGGDAAATATVTVAVNGGAADPIALDESSAGVVHALYFDDVGSGENRVTFQVEGEGRLMYQVAAEYYVPWDLVPPEPAGQEAISIEVGYDRTTLEVKDEVTAQVWIALNAPGTAQMVLVDLGVPPGFTVLTEDLQALVARGAIDRFELAGRQIVVYLTDLTQGQPVSFQYRLRAKYPLRVQVPRSLAYDYYNPDLQGEEPPVQVTVEEGGS
jgi:uncharacterized protein YfaS (alpha-2-macroglobulin family)